MNRLLLSLACLSLFFPAAARADDQPRTAEGATGNALSFRLSSGYLIEVEGRIGDQTHLKFVLDIGASISIVDQRIAAEIEVEFRRGQEFQL